MDLPDLVAHLAENAPGFAARIKAAGLTLDDLRNPKALDALPVVRKDDLVESQAANPPFGGFLACAPGELKRIFQSPGPIYDPESRVADYWRWAPALRAAGFQPGEVVLNAFGYHLTPAGAMFEEGLWAVGCTVIPGGEGNQESQVRILHDLDVTGYTGLPSYLKAWLDKANELGLSLKLNKAFVTAEPLPPSLRAALNEQGVTVRQGYGTAECGNLGYECEVQDGWHLPEDALVQVCDLTSGEPLPPGESGEIVVTLFTRDYALVRFGTGDLSALNDEACACGRTTPRLMGWQGRVGDAVKVRGMFLHPRQLSGVMARFPEVKRWQAVITRQEHKDYLTLQVVLEHGVDPTSLNERLTQTARETIKFNIAVVTVSEGELPSGELPIQDTRVWE
ncbi:MAG TPA: AMP-binding protein [Anaerolineales bacterium]